MLREVSGGNSPGRPSKINRSFFAPTTAPRQQISCPRCSSPHILPLLHLQGLKPCSQATLTATSVVWRGKKVFIKHDMSACCLRRWLITRQPARLCVKKKKKGSKKLHVTFTFFIYIKKNKWLLFFFFFALPAPVVWHDEMFLSQGRHFISGIILK